MPGITIIEGESYPDPAHTETIALGGVDVTVEFLRHACDRMRERGVLVEDVLKCLRMPDNRSLNTDPPRKAWGRLSDDGSRMLKVVFLDESREANRVLTVISVMWGKR